LLDSRSISGLPELEQSLWLAKRFTGPVANYGVGIHEIDDKAQQEKGHPFNPNILALLSSHLLDPKSLRRVDASKSHLESVKPRLIIYNSK